MAKTMGQQRAKSAWDNLVDVKNHENDDFKIGYRNSARSAAVLVMTAGLGQTLAFLRAKGKNDAASAHTWLYNHLSTWAMGQLNSDDEQRQALRDWMRRNFQMGQADDEAVDGRARLALLEWVIDQDVDVYRRATTETLAYLGWLKRFAEATLPQPDEMGE